MSCLRKERLRTSIATICLSSVTMLLLPCFAQAQQRDLERARILLVIDTNVKELRDSVSIDKRRMQGIIARTIPARRYEITILTGNKVTSKSILQYYHDLKTNEQESLLFYYAGHGATDPRSREPYFFLQEKESLFRSVVRRAMLQKHAGLTILCTDCCSSMMRIPSKTQYRDIFRPAAEIHPLVRNLFFQHRGLVDITAATNNSSWGDDNHGGIFTRTLAKAILHSPLAERAEHGFVSWEVFFPLLRRETEQTFNSWAKQQRARGEAIDQSTQRPRAFHLPSGTENDARAFAVVSIRNDKDKPVTYQCRWATDAPWQRYTLPPKGKQLHSQRLPSSSRGLPQLEVRYSKKKIKRLAAARSLGAPNEELARKYHFGKGKTTRSLGDEDEDEESASSHEEERKMADP